MLRLVLLLLSFDMHLKIYVSRLENLRIFTHAVPTGVCYIMDSSIVSLRRRVPTSQDNLKVVESVHDHLSKKELAEVYGLQNGKITSLRTYFDAATMMRQLVLLS